jgi:hypothetical protein
MRDRRAWRADATATLRDQWQPEEDKQRARHLLDIELALYLMERIAPGHPCWDVWALLGGYPFLAASGTPVDSTAEQMIAVARHLVLRFKDRYDWGNALRWYATAMPETLRGYEVDPGQSGISADSACSGSSVPAGCWLSSVVAAQLASRRRASWEGDPGSAV